MRIALLLEQLYNLNTEIEYLICECDAEEPVEVYNALREIRPIVVAMLEIIKYHQGALDDAGE